MLQMARYHERLESDGGSSTMALVEVEKAEKKQTQTRLELEQAQGRLVGMQTTLMEHETAAAIRRHEIEELRADLDVSRSEVARYSGEVQKSKERETLVRNELRAAELALYESQQEVAEFKGIVVTADHEKALNTATVEQLRLDGARLKQDLERMRSEAEGNYSRECSDMLADEIKELKIQLVATVDERCV